MPRELKIDDEFQMLCPALSRDEFALLEESVIAEGVREPLCEWNGVLIDGHHRYRIARKHGLTFNTHKLQFDSRDLVKQWMLLNQIGRRNLTPIQASYLRAQYYASIRKPHGGHLHVDNKGQSEGRTAAKVADKFGVSRGTIHKDNLLAKSIDLLDADTRAFVLSPDNEIRKEHISDLAALSEKSRALVIEKIESGKIESLQKAILKLRPPRVQGVTCGRRCKGCGALLLAGVLTCLKCDLTNKQVRKALEDGSGETLAPPDWRERLASVRQAKQSGDELLFYADQLTRAVPELEIHPGSKINVALAKLLSVLKQAVGRGSGLRKRFGEIA